MKIAEKIAKKVKTFPEGNTFTYDQLGISTAEYPAAAKAMERLVKQGKVQRASTGLFYKPKVTAFGTLQPREEELLKPYLFENDKRIAYVTGVSLYNRLGLTTQIPKTIKVASRDKNIVAKVGNVRIRPAKSYVTVTDNNYYLLEVLDAIKDFKKIPDKDQRNSILRLLSLVKELATTDRVRLIRFAQKYPPRVSALLGALLNYMDPEVDIALLRKRLNPFTAYDFGIKNEILPTAANWNIK